MLVLRGSLDDVEDVLAEGADEPLRGDRSDPPDAHEAPVWFGAAPARNQMAVLTRLEDGRMRLEFPAPLVESRFDILEFTR